MQTRGQNHEQHRDQQGRQIFLEIHDVIDVHIALIADDDAHDRHCEQARFVGEHVG